MHMSPMVEGEVERAKRKRATVIVTRFEDLYLMPMHGKCLYVCHGSTSLFACESQKISTSSRKSVWAHFLFSLDQTNVMMMTMRMIIPG